MNSLRELIQASHSGQAIEPNDFKRIVFDAPEVAPNDPDELTAGLPLPHPQFIQKAILVLGKALQVNDDEYRVVRWFFQERLSLFAMATPADVVASGRTEELLNYLDSVEAGSSG